MKNHEIKNHAKPPIGIIPERLWMEKRLAEIADAVNRYNEAGMQEPVEWANEASRLEWALKYNQLRQPPIDPKGDAMSNLRETVIRMAAEMREYICAPYRNVNDQLLRRWTDNLTAAVKADVCEWTDAGHGCYKPGCLSKMSLTSWRKEWFVDQGWQGCPYCIRKVRWTP
jgi:hypothetical protein